MQFGSRCCALRSHRPTRRRRLLPPAPRLLPGAPQPIATLQVRQIVRNESACASGKSPGAQAETLLTKEAVWLVNVSVRPVNLPAGRVQAGAGLVHGRAARHVARPP
jgi:hypothetical protein